MDPVRGLLKVTAGIGSNVNTFIMGGSPGDVGEAVHSPTFPSLHLRHSSLSMSRAHSPTFPPLHLRHSPSSNPSVASPTSQLILQPFHRFPTSQLILQPFRCFTYVTVHSPTLLSLLLRHKLFT